MANFNRKQLGLIVFLLALIIFFGFVLSKNNSPDISLHTSSTKQAEVQVKKEENDKLTNQPSEESNSFSSILGESQATTEEEKKEPFDCTNVEAFIENIANKHNEEFGAFFVDRGYWIEMDFVSTNDIINYGLGDYSTYSEDALRQLADQGDGKASMMLTLTLQQQINKQTENTLNASEQQKNQIIKHAYNAVVEGYSAGALIIMGTYINHSRLASSKDNDYSLQALTWGYVGQRRNDPLSVLFEKFTNHRIEFSEEDKKIAQKKAIEIYKNLELKRQEKGLPPFDNSYPNFLEPAYGCIKPELES